MGKKKNKQAQKDLKIRETDRQNLVLEKHSSEERFERLITYLAAGGLAVSLTFTQTSEIKEPSCLGILLYVGWILLALALIINLISQVIAINNSEKTIMDLDNDNPNVNSNISKRNKTMEIINLISLLLLITGIISLVIFTINSHENVRQ